MNRPTPSVRWFAIFVTATLFWSSLSYAAADTSTETELRIEIAQKGLGKEVVITRGSEEWFMMIEVTPENTVIVRQEKDHDRYLVDESETHDRPLTSGEVDTAIADYINSVKTRAHRK